jgi:hypothetical protein
VYVGLTVRVGHIVRLDVVVTVCVCVFVSSVFHLLAAHSE